MKYKIIIEFEWKEFTNESYIKERTNLITQYYMERTPYFFEGKIKGLEVLIENDKKE